MVSTYLFDNKFSLKYFMVGKCIYALELKIYNFLVVSIKLIGFSSFQVEFLYVCVLYSREVWTENQYAQLVKLIFWKTLFKSD